MGLGVSGVRSNCGCTWGYRRFFIFVLSFVGFIVPNLVRATESWSQHFDSPQYIWKDGATAGWVSEKPTQGDWLSVEGFPRLPVVKQKLHIPDGFEVQVELENPKLEIQSVASLPKLVPSTLFWSDDAKWQLEPSRGASNLFPGKWMDYFIEGTELSLAVFPIQWSQSNNQFTRLASGDIKVTLTVKETTFGFDGARGADSVILTSKELSRAALLLKTFHRTRLNIDSEIIFVEDLDQQYPPISEDVLPNGYKDRVPQSGTDVQVRSEVISETVKPYDPATKSGYNYERSRKIMSFLHYSLASMTPIKYLVLLGNEKQVPPSYYFSMGGAMGSVLGVTDQCYSSVDQCQTPKIGVGRLPITTESQMQSYLRKVELWLSQSNDSKSELSLFGGKAFRTKVYVGELGALRTLNENSDWRGVKKFFRTRKNYNLETVKALAAGKNGSSLVYYLDHGNGNQWFLEDEFISAKEIEEQKLQTGAVPPFIVSISCTNGAFDTELLQESLFPSASFGSSSVGVSLLRSEAGAVGYLGSARSALGAPVYEWDKKGNLSLTGSNYGLLLMDRFLEEYRHRRFGRVGDILLSAYRTYIREQGAEMSSDRNVYTYLNSVYLGDPVLNLPSRRSLETNHGLANSTMEMSELHGFPSILVKGGSAIWTWLATTSTDLNMVEVKSDYFGGQEKTIHSWESQKGAGERSLTGFKEDAVGTYFIRLENKVGVPMERQVWFDSVTINQSSATGLFVFQ